MPKKKETLSADQLNRFVVEFHSKMLMLRLVNSGKAYSAHKRFCFISDALVVAHVILKDAYLKKNTDLFNKIYTETQELVKGPYITPEIKTIQYNFYADTQKWVQGIAEYLATKDQVR
jgi:hypothetical protein